jgi:hypothetical protein
MQAMLAARVLGAFLSLIYIDYEMDCRCVDREKVV